MAQKNLSYLSLEQKKRLVNASSKISIRRQCALLGLSRSSLNYKPKPISESELKVINLVDEIYTAHPYYGTRRMQHELIDAGIMIGRQRIGSGGALFTYLNNAFTTVPGYSDTSSISALTTDNANMLYVGTYAGNIWSLTAQ